MRNVLANVPKTAGPMVASIIRTIFAQPDTEHVFAQFHEVSRMLGRSHPKVADMLNDAQDDLLAFCQFPFQHWRQIWSTNPLERVNKEIKRRTDVVGTFPNPAALLRLAGHVLIEQHDETPRHHRRGGGDPRTDRGIITTADPHGVEKIHRDDGFGSGAGVTRNYTDAVRGCLFVDLSVDAGVAAGRAGT